ncbi:hypothetical protein Y032_0126g1309 [Ancylostoma ceylanicum]|uniref:Peptidase M12A domain-containing protein n=1 Tax=Ancylostoma ceylanicum TaxID=53326 RepID=A0A016T8B4_9BILA|nr:hypothetical protein Y032_0126g1309 [Ancylostoma ceylanicum]
MTPVTENHFGQPYDYGSVMQYNPSQPTAKIPVQHVIHSVNYVLSFVITPASISPPRCCLQKPKIFPRY